MKEGRIQIFCLALACFVAAVCAAIGAWRGEHVAVLVDAEYYLLYVDGEKGVEAGAFDGYRKGGAGYVMQNKVLLNGYVERKEAEEVRERFVAKGESVGVLTMKKERAIVDRQSAERTREKIGVLKAVIATLYEAANGLERGTIEQREAKARIEGIKKVLHYAYRGEEEKIEEGVSRLLTGEKEIVKASDLRYAEIFFIEILCKK